MNWLGCPGVEEMRSLTKFGLSQLTLSFADGTDIYRARQLVTVVIGGILSSTFLTLVVLPVLYGWFERNKPQSEAR